jgi:toxin ParE1/3/4
MARLRLTGPAVQDIASILDWSAGHFGDASRRRYEALIETALRDVADEPGRPGSRELPEAFGPGRRVYHLRLSRDRVRMSGGRVDAPRHMLVYRTIPPETVVILRVLHDAMDLVRHLPAGPDDDV